MDTGEENAPVELPVPIVVPDEETPVTPEPEQVPA
jgi:hypothetical protein